jgi:predicted nucleotidyltransferase component of viral defense system
MDAYAVNQLSKELHIAPLNIIREAYELEVLDALAKSPLAKKIIFYGGTALRLAYNCPRFSEDLDFLVAGAISETAFAAAMQKIAAAHPELSLEDVKEKRNTLFALFKIRSPLLKHALPLKIELAKRKNGIEKEFRPLSSPCSSLQPALFAATIKSLRHTKEMAIKNRNLARDWFDLWYISALQRQPFIPPAQFPFDKTEFKRELKRFLPADRWALIDEVLKACHA